MTELPELAEFPELTPLNISEDDGKVQVDLRVTLDDQVMDSTGSGDTAADAVINAIENIPDTNPRLQSIYHQLKDRRAVRQI
jgi:hypothetical protein